MQNEIYADYAATAPVAPEVLAAMQPYWTDQTLGGNPSALYRRGIDARKTLLQVREEIAALLSAAPEEIVFTSGGTESDNTAVSGCLLALEELAKEGRGKDRREIVLSALEHPAVGACCRFWQSRGYKLRYLPVGRDGRVDREALDGAVTEKTALVCLMAANNETGVVQPVREAAERAHSKGAVLLCDAVQAAPWTDVGSRALGGADFISVSGHKLGTPRGVGLLYVRRGAPLSPILFGGGQENGMRAGTENVAGAVGLLAALRRAAALREDNEKVRRLGEGLRAGLSSIPGARLHGGPDGIPGLVNVSFACVEGQILVSLLAKEGICASPGAACSARRREPSPSLLAMGCGEAEAMGAVRFSLSHENTEEEVESIRKATEKAVARLRSLDLAGSKIYNM